MEEDVTDASAIVATIQKLSRASHVLSWTEAVFDSQNDGNVDSCDAIWDSETCCRGSDVNRRRSFSGGINLFSASCQMGGGKRVVVHDPVFLNHSKK